MRRLVVAGGEAELAELLELFPAGVEELDGGFAVYTDDAGEERLRERFAVAGVAEIRDGWEDEWRSFHRGAVAGRFWIGPPWERSPAGFEAIVIDPGRAFGTGAHPTTRLALELLQELPAGSLLDVGCGSGVLSIAAARLGFAPIVGLDSDPAAVEAAEENARANGVHVDVRLGDALTNELPAVEVVVANIARDVVEALLPRLRAVHVVASGYLERDDLQSPGWQRVARRVAGGWAADLFERL